MSAEMLRRAASLMRERAEAATEAPWDAVQGASGGWWIEAPYTATIADLDIDHSIPEADATHIASWHPAVALAVADLLDLAAGHEKREGEEAGQGYTANGYGYIDPSCSICGTPDEYAEPWPCAYATRGLAVARAYLQESS